MYLVSLNSKYQLSIDNPSNSTYVCPPPLEDAHVKNNNINNRVAGVWKRLLLRSLAIFKN